MTAKDGIIKRILEISGKYSAREIFTDWVKLMALSISNSTQMIHNRVWKERERMYMELFKKYDSQEQKQFIDMFSLLCIALGDKKSDVLGEIYMGTNQGNKATGQFFTPYHLSLLAATIAIISNPPNKNGIIEICEPSCGGGGMIIGCADILEQQGIDYQKVLKVTCQDLDYTAVYMTYVQLSMLGIRATVVQGDTLREPYDKRKTDSSHIYYTPAERGLLF